MFSGTLQRSLVFDVHPHHVQPVLVSGHPCECVQIYGGGRVAAGSNDLPCACMTDQKRNNGGARERWCSRLLLCRLLYCCTALNDGPGRPLACFNHSKSVTARVWYYDRQYISLHKQQQYNTYREARWFRTGVRPFFRARFFHSGKVVSAEQARPKCRTGIHRQRPS